MTNSTGSGRQLLTVKQLADLLAVSVTSVYRLTDQRAIPFFRFSRGLRFDAEDVAKFLNTRRVETVD
jgi:excisionase family DNA binding protein